MKTKVKSFENGMETCVLPDAQAVGQTIGWLIKKTGVTICHAHRRYPSVETRIPATPDTIIEPWTVLHMWGSIKTLHKVLKLINFPSSG
jgi:hypothetical protein